MATSQVATSETPPMTTEDLSNLEKDENGLILGKFKSQEDLIKAYSELEKAQSSRQEKPSNEQGEGEVSEANVSSAIQNASDAFYENGELSEDNFRALEQSGITREFVEAYVRGQKATMEAEAASITNSIGGQENYDAMVQWASANLPEAEASFKALLNLAGAFFIFVADLCPIFAGVFFILNFVFYMVVH